MVRSDFAQGASEREYYRENWQQSDGRMDKYIGDFSLEMPRPFSKPVTIEQALNEYCHIPAANFAVVVVGHDGHIKTYTSEPLRNAAPVLFSPEFMKEFDRALRQPNQGGPYTQSGYRIDNFSSFNDTDTDDSNRRHSSSTDSSTGRRGNYHRVKMEGDDSDEEELRSAKGRKRSRWGRIATVPEDDTPIPTPVTHTRQLIIGNTSEVAQFYTQRFKDLQQSACKVIAKAFVKIMEPKKQTNHPYTGGQAKAPSWWPTSTGLDKVRHREPDHLMKTERVQLLVHILQVVVDQSPAKQGNLLSVTIRRLEEVTNEAMTNWFGDKDHPDNANKRPFLREIFKVAKQEERYMKGEIDATCSITIMHGDDRAGICTSDDEPDDSLKYNDDEIAGQNVPPSTQNMASPDSMISPHNTHFQTSHQNGDDSDGFGYTTMRELPVRSYHQGHPTPPEDHQGFSDTSGGVPLTQVNYISRPHMNYQQHQDPARRASWQPQTQGFPNASPSNLFTNTWNPNGVMQHNPMQYNAFTTSAPPNGPQTAPFLPPPISTPLLPPMHHQQQYGDGLMNRNYEPAPPLPPNLNLRSQSASGISGLSQHQSYQDYLHDQASYVGHPDGGELKVGDHQQLPTS